VRGALDREAGGRLMPPSRLVTQRLQQLEDRLAGDPVLRAELADFMARPVDDWTQEGVDVVCTVGARLCRLSSSQIELSHQRFSGSKRIPL
jgi:hypothetical protein